MHCTLIRAALDAGASGAVIIPQSTIVLSENFLDICAANQCGCYDRCWMCPPALPPAREAMAQIRAFPQALWYQSIGQLEDSFDVEGMFETAKNHAQLGQRIQSAVKTLLREPVLHLTCGGCHLCPTCTRIKGLPCRMPGKALPSMEGYCVDVYNTTKDTPLKYINGQNTVTYFGMVLFRE